MLSILHFLLLIYPITRTISSQVPPTNQTKLEGEKAQFTCEAKALPGNVTVRWFREGSPVREVAALETRVSVKRDGSLIVNPVSADDSGQYLCEVTNGIGEPQSASAYLNVECEYNNYFMKLSCIKRIYFDKESFEFKFVHFATSFMLYQKQNNSIIFTVLKYFQIPQKSHSHQLCSTCHFVLQA